MSSGPHARPHWHDAYDAQMALWRWYRAGDRGGRIGARWLAESYEFNAKELQDGTKFMLSELYAAEFGRLIDLDPIYVSEEMCEVVEAASESFKPEALLETDLITPRGFLYFARPFEVPDRFEKPMTIQAASWTRIYQTVGEAEKRAFEDEVLSRSAGLPADPHGDFGPWEHVPGQFAIMETVAEEHGVKAGGVALTIYSQTDAAKLHGWVQESHASGGWPPVIPTHLTPWYFGMDFDGNQWDEIGKPTGAVWWWKVVQTTFRLMQQRLAHRSLARPDRAGRREARRLSFRDDTEVVIVRLRREAGERHDPTGEEANYSHRFIVSGHWRNQWYPSDRVHRHVGISPYVKGPEDKPLIVRPRRVYQWER